MKKSVWMQCAALLALSLFANANVLADETPTSLAGVTVVSADEAKQWQDRGAPMIDTREYAPKTVLGAITVPYKEKSGREEGFDPSHDEFDMTRLPADKNAALVFFCNAGECWKSYKASMAALKAGYTQIKWMRGGFPEWLARGLPTR